MKEHNKTLHATEDSELRNSPGRKRFQEHLIQQYTDAGDSDAVKALRRIQRAEATAEVFKQCATARGLNREGGLSHVPLAVPQDPTMDPKQCPQDEWEAVVDPKQVETAIRE